MPLTANITLSPPALSDASVWFANALEWNNYWTNTPATVSLSITTTTYTESAYNTGLNPSVLNIDGVDHILATKAMLDSLITRVDTLNTAFLALKTQMYNAGFITLV